MSENLGEPIRKISLGHRPKVRQQVLSNVHRIAKNTTGPINLSDALVEARHDAAQNIRAERLKKEAIGAKENGEIDELTQLRNRRGFNRTVPEMAARAKRQGKPLTIISFDLDGLKEVNDTKGHSAGDKLIREAAQVLKRNIREIDIAARLGGDEFAVLLSDTNIEGAKKVWDRINTDSQNNEVRVSAGVAEIDPTTTQTIDESVRISDLALYRAKKQSHETGQNAACTSSELTNGDILDVA